MDYSILVPERARGPAFCDWLTTTCKPVYSFEYPLGLFLDNLGFCITYSDSSSRTYSLPNSSGTGSLKLQTNSKFHLASCSGGILKFLRDNNLLSNYLDIISEVPHSVTRLDVACDYSIDAPIVLRALENAYPNDKCKLSRKHCKVTRMYSSRESDGQLSGTWYAGHKQDVVISARIYDKSLELLNKKFLATNEPITRLELTASKSVGCTLRDAVICDPLFYKLASPAFVSVPPGIPDWEPFGDYCNWVSDPSVPALPIEIIRKKFEFSPDISRIVDLVAPLGEEGISMALRMFEKRLRSIV